MISSLSSCRLKLVTSLSSQVTRSGQFQIFGCHRISTPFKRWGSTYRVIQIEAQSHDNDKRVVAKEESMNLRDIVKFDGNMFGTRDFLSFSIIPEPIVDHLGIGDDAVDFSSHPKILPRGDHILVSFGHIKALIGNRKGLVFDAHTPGLNLFGVELANLIQDKMSDLQVEAFTDDDFEFIFLEEVLREVSSTWKLRAKIYEKMVDSLLTVGVTSKDFSSEVPRVAPLKDSLKKFQMQIEEANTALQELLNDDDKMLGLLLTEQEAARKRMEIIDSNLHSAVERVLENYIRSLNHLLQNTIFLLNRVQSKVELIELSIDAHRNRLIEMNVNLSIVAVCLASSTTIAGFFGMNVISGYEESFFAFPTILCGSGALGISIGVWCLRYLSKSQSTAEAQKRQQDIEKMSSVLRYIDHVSVSLSSFVGTIYYLLFFLTSDFILVDRFSAKTR